MESPTIEKMKIENLLASNHVIKFKDLLLYNTWQPSRNTKSAITKHQRSGMTPTNHRINHLFHIWLIKNWVIMRRIQFVTRIPEIQSNSAEMTKDLRKMILCRNGWHKWNNVIKSASSSHRNSFAISYLNKRLKGNQKQPNGFVRQKQRYSIVIPSIGRKQKRMERKRRRGICRITLRN